jgi:ammonia channel protein AmtB
MALTKALRNSAIVIEKYVDLAATSGTTVGVAVPAGTLIVAAGFEPSEAVPNVTTYTMDITDGTTTFADDLNFDNTAAGTILVGTTAGLVAAADTVDVVTTISGTPGIISGRVFVVAVDVNESRLQADEVDRDTLA